MKKIYAILAVFLCVGMIAPVYGASIEQAYTDSWGRTCLFDNGDAIYFGQTVAVTNSSIACNYEYEVIENCTVTVKTNGHVVVVDENGDPIISKNGFEFRYTSNWRFILTGMTWNNFPNGGSKVEVVTVGTITQKVLTFLDGRPYSRLPETFTVGDVVFTHDTTCGNAADYYYSDEAEQFYINVYGTQKAYFGKEGDFDDWYLCCSTDWFDGNGSFKEFITTLNVNAEIIDQEVFAGCCGDDWDCWITVSQGGYN